ncbi:MAG: hypothetical protein ACI8SR_002294 [Oceanicoccus sp.]|jgi:hypothetical protein
MTKYLTRVWEYFTVFLLTSAWLKAINVIISRFVFIQRMATLKLNKRFTSITVKLLLPLLFIALVIQWGVPAIGVHLAKKWYAEQGNGYELVVANWSFIPWRGFVSLGGVELRHGENISGIHELKVNIAVLDLFQHKLTLESLYFDGLKLNIDSDDKGLTAVGVSLTALNAEAKEQAPMPEVSAAPSAWVIKIEKIEMKNHQIGFSRPDLNISLAVNDMAINGDLESKNLTIASQVTLHSLSVSEPKIALTQPLILNLKGAILNPFTAAEFLGELQLSNARINTPWVSHAGFSQLSLSDISLSLKQQSLGLLELTDLFLGDDLVKLSQYKIHNTTLKDASLIMASHEWSGLNSVVKFDENGGVAGLMLAAASPDETVNYAQAESKIHTPQTAVLTTEGEQSAFKILIAEIKQLDTDVSRVRIINKHVDPEFDMVFELDELTATHINNYNEVFQYKMLSKTDEYSRVSLDGSMKLGGNLNGNINLDIEQFDLISLSGYVEKAIGYHVAQGQLNFKMGLNIDDGKLAGNGKLKVVNSQLVPSDKATMDQVSKKISMPIETALSLIKDDNNNIEMNVPITGDLNSPDFGLDDLISKVGQKALSAATMHFLKQAIFPYGLLISVAGYVGDELFSITLMPIEYVGEALNEEQLKYIQKIADLMQDKTVLQLRVCAQVDKLEAEKENWYAAALEKSNKIKRNLVQLDKTLSGRIVLCQPVIGDKTQVKMGF